MKLTTKIISLFSIIMAVAIALFTSFTQDMTTKGSEEFTRLRFSNMSASISQDIELQIDMMELTLDELTKDTSFAATLNQFIRDDSEDQKMANAAKTAALQTIYQSPMAERYYCVNFLSMDGAYFSSIVNKDGITDTSREEMLEVLDIVNTLFETESELPFRILAPHQDSINKRNDSYIYGLVQPVTYHGNRIGYISIHNECSSLDHLLTFVDNTEEVEIQAVFDDGNILYCSKETERAFTDEIPVGTHSLWEDQENGQIMEVLASRMEDYGLTLYIARDSSITTTANKFLTWAVWKRALLIMLAAIAVITPVALEMTGSIRRLTARVKNMDKITILDDEAALNSINRTVTSEADKEMRLLEQSYNNMLQKLLASTQSEIMLRESTLQAHLNALQTQINPHFIYNTLNIISAKAMELDNFDIIEICDQFASMLRYSTDTRSKKATMKEELENVNNYLHLAKARYEENLEFTMDVPDILHSIEIPKLTLQPLVENAITHGFDGKNIFRKISIIGIAAADGLLLEIRDNGNGFSDAMLLNLREQIAAIDAGQVSVNDEMSGHIGLLNTCLRLYYYSNGRIHVKVDNDHGAVVTLSIPADQ